MTSSINIDTLSRWTGRLHDFISSHHGLPARELRAARLPSETTFNELALELYSLQTRLNPAYAAWAQLRQTLPLRSWMDIPAMPASGFKELALSCLPPDQRSIAFHSSGTTGQSPSRHYHNSLSLKSYELSLVTWFQKHLIFQDDRPQFILLTPPPDQAPHSSLVHMLEVVSRRFSSHPPAFAGQCNLPSGPWILNIAESLRLLESSVHRPHPVCLMGTAFNFVHLLDHLTASRTRYLLPPRSSVMETGGYKNQSRSVSKEALHASITDRLGIPASRIVSEYGMSELSSQAYDASVTTHSISGPGLARFYRFPPWARALVICPEAGIPLPDGQPGLLRIVDLANAWSVLAVQTEDLAIMRQEGFVLKGRSLRAEPRGCSLQTA